MLGFENKEFYKDHTVTGGFDIAEPPNWVPPAALATCKFSAVDPPTLYRLGKGSQYLPVIFDAKSGPVSQSVPSTGAVGINEIEVATYDALDEATPWLENMRILSLLDRGAMGSEVFEYCLKWEWDTDHWKLGSTDRLPVKLMWGLADTDILSLILTLAISTGGNRYTVGDYAGYDVASVGEWQGAAIPGPCFDLDSFDKAREQYSQSVLLRSFVFSEPMNLRDFIDRELTILGLCLVPKPTPGGYALSIVDTRNIVNQWVAAIGLDASGGLEIQTGTGQTVIPAGMTPDDRLRITHDIEQVINAVTIRPLYDCAAEKQLDTRVTYNEVDSQIEYGVKRSLDLDLKGLGTSESAAIQVAGEIAPGILARFSRRCPLFTFYTTRAAWRFGPGDQVVLSFPGIPNEEGGRGITSQTLTALKIEKSYFDPSGSWCCKITGVGAMDGNYSYYAPSATVTSKGTDGTGDYLALSASAFSTATEPNPFSIPAADVIDALWFAGATKIRVYNRGAEDVDSEVLTVDTAGVDVNTGKVYVTALPALTVGAETRLTFADWDEENIASVQMQFAFIADNDGNLTDFSSVETEGFKYL